jgi:endogenous inhibitor of DNA gyrase (YacG/DUF329 family)
MHENEVEISPFKTRVRLLRCPGCGKPVASERVHQAMTRKGGPTLLDMFQREPLCQRCKRVALAAKLTAVVPGNGSSGARVK